jgi:FkbM family methyltransferase
LIRCASPRPIANALVAKSVQISSGLIRRIPLNRRKWMIVNWERRLNRYSYDLTFRCPHNGVTWSAAGIPVLMKHVELNGLSNVTIEDTALSDRQGEAPFYVQTGDVSWNSTMIREFSRGKSFIMVKTLTLDEYVSRSRCVPALVKIDTEGGEMSVLKGAAMTITRHRPALIMELNPASASAAGTTVGEYVDFLRSEEYRLFVLGRDRRGFYRLQIQQPFDERRHASRHLVNAVAVPRKVGCS